MTTARDLRAALAAEIAAVGLSPTSRQLDLLIDYLDLISRWRTRARLTAITDPRAAARLHIADSLLPLRAGFAEAAAFIDVGSGAGLPGIPLKIVREDLDATLLEAESRKAAFLELAVRELGLSASIRCVRAEAGGHEPELRERFDIATARAVAPLRVLCELTLPFVRAGGKAVLLKGPAARDELRDGRPSARFLGGGDPQVLEARLAGGEVRLVVVIEKVTPTPAGYPRRAGVPLRRPL